VTFVDFVGVVWYGLAARPGLELGWRWGMAGLDGAQSSSGWSLMGLDVGRGSSGPVDCELTLRSSRARVGALGSVSGASGRWRE
jgi:hypothetical protein